jgi:hypothetical protein
MAQILSPKGYNPDLISLAHSESNGREPFSLPASETEQGRPSTRRRIAGAASIWCPDAPYPKSRSAKQCID